MGLFGDISEQQKERKETIKIFTEIGKNKDVIIKSLKKVSEMSFKRPKGGKYIPKWGRRGTKEGEIINDHIRSSENREREGYINKLNDEFNIKIGEEYVYKIINYVKWGRDSFYRSESGLIFGRKKYLKTLRNILND